MAETTTFKNATQILEPFRGVKRVTIEEYFTSGHRTCQGCESALVMKLIPQERSALTEFAGEAAVIPMKEWNKISRRVLRDRRATEVRP